MTPSPEFLARLAAQEAREAAERVTFDRLLAEADRRNREWFREQWEKSGFISEYPDIHKEVRK